MSIAAFTKPIEKKVNKTIVKLIRDDLTALPVNAWVYYAREDLQTGSGYGTAIQMRGGVIVQKELEKFGGVKMGEAVITGSGDMKSDYIIHACGPKFQEPDTEKKLRDCMNSVLKLASEKGLKTIAFPPMGAGFYGVPLALSAKVMFEAIKAHLQGNTSLEEVIICTIDKRDFEPFKAEIEKL